MRNGFISLIGGYTGEKAAAIKRLILFGITKIFSTISSEMRFYNMTKSIAVPTIHPEYQLYQRKNKVFCTSLQVAQEFNKLHKNVLRDIRNLGCSDEFRRLNFELTSQNIDMPHGGTRNETVYLMTKDGFMFLISGYTGEKAGAIKEAYIARFNAMEAFIRDYILAKDEFPIFTQAIADAYDEPHSWHFKNEIDMIYRIVLGMDAKHFREIHGLSKGENIRPYLTETQYRAVRKLQAEDIRMLYRGANYLERKNKLSEYARRSLAE